MQISFTFCIKMLIINAERIPSMHKFDFSFLENGSLPAGLVNVTTGIYTLRERSSAREAQFVRGFTELAAIAKVQSVKSSNAIEGIITTDQRINEIVNGNSAPLNHNEQEIAGYRDALAEVHSDHTNLEFRQADILRLHAIMMNIAGYSDAWKFKDTDNRIIEVDQTGQRRVRFQPTPATDTPESMDQLILAYEEARDNPNINQLLLIPCVILDFLCIHPFRDGNGRMSRLLSLLLLYRSGFDAGRYISFEEQINLRKVNYYAALKLSSAHWHDNQNNYSFFITEFLTTLYLCYKELDKRFAVIGSRKVTKQARIEATILNSLTPISKGDIGKILPDVSITTIESVLGKLMKGGLVRKIGTGRATRYVRA